MAVDVQLALAVVALHDHMRLPDLFEEGAGCERHEGKAWKEEDQSSFTPETRTISA
jgi:hypothetical protein